MTATVAVTVAASLPQSLKARPLTLGECPAGAFQAVRLRLVRDSRHRFQLEAHACRRRSFRPGTIGPSRMAINDPSSRRIFALFVCRIRETAAAAAAAAAAASSFRVRNRKAGVVC